MESVVPIEDKMPFLSHLKELRKRFLVSIVALFAGFVVAFIFYDKIIGVLFKPLLVLNTSVDDNVLYINTIFEGFSVRFKISLLSGLILTLPVHVFNLMRFIFPALRRKEKIIISATVVVSFFFVIGSFFYSYYSIIPVSIQFLTSKEFIPAKAGLLLSFGTNIFYILQFMLVALVMFQVPIILEVLMVLKVVSRKVLLNYGKYIVVMFFIVSAVLTPPDFVTQVGLALPMTFLYYLSILVAKIFRFGEDKCSE